ncbi:hypothetical protein HQ945_09015 [Phyllobacterium sp. BT25]|uniref:Uncharacterized protein n=1 Tax=Phyllobacterium pellucidum TaxID=2740464 RepID=A0A849VNB6_9HYPH|nr:hypothetical protein [Phyllobacterium pellucidum]NTS31392.1 hypothetical protein [Phyllobacterium pellucidum]
MADRPILFSAPTVQALLAGRKTQTRRILKPQPNMLNGGRPLNNGRGAYSTEAGWKRIRFAVGDRLYVREHWRTFASLDVTPPRDLWSPNCGHGAGILYIADGFGLAVTREGERWSGDRDDPAAFGKHRQAMHMPRWASRLTLLVTGVRIQRLQDISEEDAIAEGAELSSGFSMVSGGQMVKIAAGTYLSPVAWYHWLWDQINGKGSWEANPWVVAVTFDVLKQNIDEVR